MNERVTKSEVDRVLSDQMRQVALKRKGNSSEIARKSWITRRANIAKAIRAGEIKVPAEV